MNAFTTPALITLAALACLGCGRTGARPLDAPREAVRVDSGTDPLDAGLDSGVVEPDAGVLSDASVPDASVGPGCASQVAAGGTHTCALRTDGELWCWGYDLDGRLGLGTTGVEARPPTRIPGVGGRVVEVVAGSGHTCVRAEGPTRVACWGFNDAGQVGNGTVATTVTEPASVSLPQTAQRLVAGRFHTCALSVRGRVYCWGDNIAGAIGDGVGGTRPSPVRVGGFGGRVVTLAAGSGHNCALSEDGAVRCWGFNAFGQLGGGSVRTSALPVRVSGLGGDVDQLAAGWSLSCALDRGGAVSCWGGLVGDGTRDNGRTPTPLTELSSDTVELSSGFTHTCALRSDGSAWCWGSNQNEEIRSGREDFVLRPVQSWATGTPPAAEIDVGEGFTCARYHTGSIRCWGSSVFGAVDGTQRRFPNHVTPPTEVELPCP